MTQEIWKAIPRFPEYHVSSHGRIKRALPYTHPLWASRKYGFITTHRSRAGYERVSIRVGGRCVRKFVHAFVLEAFHGPRQDGQQANHLNCIKSDNRPENLAWVTASENCRHAVENNRGAFGVRHWTRHCPSRIPRGEKHYHAKLTDQDIQAIRRADLSRFGAAASLARRFKISHTHLTRIRNAMTWSHIA